MNHLHRKRLWLAAVVLVAISGGGRGPAAYAEDSPQEAAVRQTLAALGQAFNAHDAAAFGAAWTEDAVYADPVGGVQVDGRTQIQAWYAQLFKEQPQASLKAEISAIEFDGDARAFVRGRSEVTPGGGEPVVTSFLAELVKTKDQWLVASVEESDPDPLTDLEWLVGDWKDDREGPSIESTFAWEGNGRFLVRKYTISDENGPKRTGTQYVVGDAASGTLRSWVFDSEGALAEGQWTAKDDHWAIHWTVTLPNGRVASATQVLKPVDQDTFEVKWSDIDVDGDMRPSTDPVTVRRVVATAANTGDSQHE